MRSNYDQPLIYLLDELGKIPSFCALPSLLYASGSSSVNRNAVRLCVHTCSVLSHVRLFVTPWTMAHQASLSFTVSRFHWVSEAIQPPHPLSSPSPPALNLSQHQGLFQWVGSLYQVAKVLEFQLQHQSFQWIFRNQDWLVWFSCCPRDPQESSSPPQFESINSLVLSLLYGPILTCTWLLEQP